MTNLAKGALLLLSLSVLVPTAGAQTIDPDALADAEDGIEIVPKRKLDVVQNKSFEKEKRLEVYLHAFGAVTNNQFAHRRITASGLGLSYHVKEQVFIDLSAQYLPYGEGNIKSLTDALLAYDPGTDDIDPVIVPAEKLNLSASLGFSPIYGKINLVGEHVQNFDVSFLLGAGMLQIQNYGYRAGPLDENGYPTRLEVQVENEWLVPTVHLGIASRFPLLSWMTVKGDARFVGYIQEVTDYDVEITEPNADGDLETNYGTKRAFANAFIVTGGVSFFLPR